MTLKPTIGHRTLLYLAVYLFLLVSITRTEADVDLWGHLRFGEDIVASGFIPQFDYYSFTSDRYWINHEWLSEVAMYLAYAGGGPWGLGVLKLATIAATMMLVAGVYRREGAKGRALHLALIAGIICTFPRMQSVRPQLFSLLAFAMLLRLMLHADAGGRRLLWAAPVLMAVWANLHGGWIVGLGTFCIWAIFALAERGRDTGARAELVVITIATMMASLVNPYRASLWMFLQETVGLGRPDIVEWLPIFRVSAGLVALWSITALLAAASLARARWRVRPGYLAIVVVLALGSLRVNRLDAFFNLGVLMLLAPQIVQLLRRRDRSELSERSGKPLDPRFVPVAIAAMLMVVMTAGVNTAANMACVQTRGWWVPESRAIDFFRLNGLRGRLVTAFDWGETAIWHLAPAIRVSIDGRRETVYGRSIISAHSRFYRNENDGWRYAEQLGADYVWLPRAFPVVKALERRGWRRIFDGESSVVLTRKQLAGILQPTAADSNACFPEI
jgi:hypothetical protein